MGQSLYGAVVGDAFGFSIDYSDTGLQMVVCAVEAAGPLGAEYGRIYSYTYIRDQWIIL